MCRAAGLVCPFAADAPSEAPSLALGFLSCGAVHLAAYVDDVFPGSKLTQADPR
jgi:hypothetical protein